MKIKKFASLALLSVLLASLISGCTGSATVASSWPGLTVNQDKAYLAYNQQVYAINILNGNEIWRYPEEANAKITFYAPPELTSDDQLIVGSYNNTLYSLNATNGNENWSFSNATNRFIANPLVTDEGIYAPNSNNTLYKIGLQGNLLWEFETTGEQWAQPVIDPDGSKIYISSFDHAIYAIDQNGQLQWKTEDDLGGAIVGSPALGSDQVMYVGTFGAQMIAINTANGDVKWRANTDGWIWSAPAVKDNVLYFGDIKQTFYALDAENGNVLWKYPTDGPVVGTPLLMDDTIYFCSEIGTLYALDFQGKAKWSKTIDEVKLYQSPILAGDLLLLAPVGSDYILAAYDLNGNQKWTFAPAKK